MQDYSTSLFICKGIYLHTIIYFRITNLPNLLLPRSSFSDIIIRSPSSPTRMYVAISACDLLPLLRYDVFQIGPVLLYVLPAVQPYRYTDAISRSPTFTVVTHKCICLSLPHSLSQCSTHQYYFHTLWMNYCHQASFYIVSYYSSTLQSKSG